MLPRRWIPVFWREKQPLFFLGLVFFPPNTDFSIWAPREKLGSFWKINKEKAKILEITSFLFLINHLLFFFVSPFSLSLFCFSLFFFLLFLIHYFFHLYRFATRETKTFGICFKSENERKSKFQLETTNSKTPTLFFLLQSKFQVSPVFYNTKQKQCFHRVCFVATSIASLMEKKERNRRRSFCERR